MALDIQGNDGAATYKVGATARGQIKAFSVSESEAQEATELGDGYNINSGVIGLTSSTESGVLYFKNNESRRFIIEAITVGIGSAGTTSDMSIVKVIKNPTLGTLISGATDVDMNTNRSFGSSNALAASLAYKGAEGSTVTDGEDLAIFFQSAGGRLFAGIALELNPGNSVAITVDTQTTAGTTNVYAAIVGHLKAE
jgi:hypothetical protein